VTALFVALCAGFLIAILRLWPDSELGRFLRPLLVERPAATGSKLERHHLIWAGIVLFVIVGAGELATFYGSEFLFAYSLDLSLYLDAMLVTAALAMVSRLRSVSQVLGVCRRRAVRRRAHGHKGAARPRAAHRRRTSRHIANDEDGPSEHQRVA
jgi:hypothetical protein